MPSTMAMVAGAVLPALSVTNKTGANEDKKFVIIAPALN